jgi:ribosome maturation factor RimP
MINKKKIETLALERIEELDKGLFIVEIKISSSNVIQVEIDAEEGNVAIEDCVSVSRNIEHNLDREEQDFELQVSSAGLDKPFRVTKQYIKNIGEDVKVKLNQGGKLEGRLIDANQEHFVVETTRKERLEGKKKKETIIEQHKLGYDEVKETKIVISFKKMKS